MTPYLIPLTGGFIASFHCIGMCGGFACGLAQGNNQSRSQLIIKTLSYNLGRLTTYVFIGALAGLLGATLLGHNQHGTSMPMVFNGGLGIGQRLLSFTAGLLMIAVSLQLLGFRRHIPASWGRIGGVTFARALQTLIRSNRLSASLSLGVANGFLPCPLVYAFAASAAATASVATGSITMLAFALGTFPAMLLMTGIGHVISPVVRQRGVYIGAAFILVVGLITLFRGLLPGMLHGGMH